MAGILANSPADVVKKLIEEVQDQAIPIAEAKNWPVFAVREPDKPDNAITVYDTVGLNQGREHRTPERMEWQGVQIRVRSATYPLGYMKAEGVAICLDQQIYHRLTQIGAAEYMVDSVRRISGPIPFPGHRATGSVLTLPKAMQGDRRHYFVINALVNIRQTNAIYNTHPQDDPDSNLVFDVVPHSGGISEGTLLGTAMVIDAHPGTGDSSDLWVVLYPGDLASYVSLGDTPIFESDSGFAIGLTLKRGNAAPLSTEYLADKSGAFSLSILKDAEGKVASIDLNITDGTHTITGSYKHVAGFSEILPLDEWHCLVVTYSGNGLASGIHMYLDGIPVNNKIGGLLNIGSVPRNTNQLRVGWGFSGMMTDASFWQVELSQAAAAQYTQDHVIGS